MKAVSVWGCAAAAAVLLTACGGSKEEKKAEPKAEQAMVAAPSQDDMVASCVKMREQMQLCRDQAIDMMMEERAKVNPDLQAKMADEAQKTALREQGLAELDADGAGGEATLAARTDKCKEMAGRMPAQVPQATMDLFNGLSGCWDKPCGDRVACVRPFVAATMSMPGEAAKPTEEPAAGDAAAAPASGDAAAAPATN